MKCVMLSIRPKWVEKIASGEKTIEVRKSAPKEVPIKAYIYMTKNGKVIGEFICDKVEKFSVGSLRSDDIEKLACLSYNEMINYFYNPEELDGKTVKQGFAWHISDLKIYDKPKELNEFNRPCSYAGLCFSCDRAKFTSKGDRICQAMITRPPQSYMYVEELGE